MFIEEYLPLFISTLIGLLIGIEREKAHPDSDKMGVRTFVLTAFLGGLLGLVERELIVILVSAFTLCLFGLAYFKQGQRKPNEPAHDLTTEIAAVIVFCLGYLSHRNPIGVSFLGPFVALVLVSKERLHSFSKHIRVIELEAAIVLFLLATGVLGLVADRAIDPWGLLNPRKFGILVLVLAALEFASYLALKFMSAGKSALVTGLLGGVVSSTVVLLQVSRESAQDGNSWRRLTATGISATIASLGELLLILSIAPIQLVGALVLPVGLAAVIGGAFIFWALHGRERSPSTVSMTSPLNLKGVLRLAVALATMLILVGLTQRTFGERGTHVLAFLAGLFELHGFSLATSTLFAQGQMQHSTAVLSIGIAAFASFVSKLGIVWAFGRGPFVKVMSFAFLIMAAVAAATLGAFIKQ